MSVSPPTATVDVQATVQLTATPRNAAGAALGGKAVTWSADPQSVASVNTSGIVTGVSAGSATVTATSDGKSGTATITVQQGANQVVASATIGPAGGSISSADIGITVPAGGLVDSRRLEIVVDDHATSPFGEYTAAKEFRVSGFPSDRLVPVSVRLKATTALDGVSLIARGAMVRTSTEDATPELRYAVTPAKDSSGWLVATVNVMGQPASMFQSGATARARPSTAEAAELFNPLDGYLVGIKSADTLSTPHFRVVSFGAPRSQLQPLLAPTLQYVEEAYTAIAGLGHSFAFRKTWPVSVSVRPMPEHPTWYAYFNTEGPFPADPETGFMEFNSLTSGETMIWPGVAIHELFHFMQTRYGSRLSDAKFTDSDWFNEATSSWIMERAPSNLLAAKNTFFRGWRDYLFTGIHPDLTANDGYSKGALIKYITDRWGDATVKDVYSLFGTGMSTMESFVSSLPVSSTLWWPDFLTAYMGNQVYALAQDELVPGSSLLGAPHPGWTFYQLTDRHSVSARGLKYEYDAAKISSGTNLKIRFRSADSASFQMLGFQANDAGAWTALGPAADTLLIPGSVLRQGKKIVAYAIRPDAVAPYTSHKSTVMVAEMGLQDGDWLMDGIREINDGIVYTSTKVGDATKIDVAENVDDVARLLASAGVFKHSNALDNAWTWTPYPGVADTLAKYGVTMSGTLGISANFNYVLKSRLEIGVASAGSAGAPRESSFLWYLLPIGFVPLFWRRRTRRLGAFAVVAMTTALWSCDIGSISFMGKFAYEFALPEASVQYLAEAGDSTVAVLKYDGVSGKLVVEAYRSEYWDYIRNDLGEKTDSVRQVRTGAGTATFKVDGLLYYDGKVPAPPDDDATAIVSRLLQRPGIVTAKSPPP